MSIKEFHPENRRDWLALRHRDVTGSEAAALLGLHRYTTVAKLHAEKIGPVKDESGTSVMTRGVKLEKFVADELKNSGVFKDIVKAGVYFRDVEVNLGGTPDYFIKVGSDTGILEIKTVGQRDFVQNWQGGDPNADPVPEPWQMVQLLTYIYLAKADFGKIAVLPVGDWSPMDIQIVDVPYRESIIDRLRNECLAFWKRIERGETPPIDFNDGRDLDAIKAIYGTAKPGKELRGTKELRTAIDAWETAKEEERLAGKSKKEMETYIRSLIGDAETVHVPGGILTAKNTHRDAYNVAACDFRTLRFKESKINAT